MRYCNGVLLLATILTAGAARGEEFQIQVGDTVSPGVPGTGAGVLEEVSADDIYTFTGTAGQHVFFEELSVDSAFRGWAYWQLRSPNGTAVFGSYFDNSIEGRKTLPETGTYRLRVYVAANDPNFKGNYSFRLRAIPPDQTFAIQIGDTISEGVPGAGAGSIEVPGAQDHYTFAGTEGQLIFAEELGASQTFQRWLQWEIKGPAGQSVFSTYLDGSHPGRLRLPATGNYLLRVYVQVSNTNYLGDYSFRLRPVPPDQTFALNFGDTVTNGIPASGAGNISAAGEYEFYEFSGTKDQSVFFEVLGVDSTFDRWLSWEAKTPSGQTLFSAELGSASVGRKTLPETGTYRIRVWVADNDPTHLGNYSFRLTATDPDGRFDIQIGNTITNGVPGIGAGRIEQSGGQDFYTFTGTAGQNVIFEEISVDPAFAGWLTWEIKAPNGSTFLSGYLHDDKSQRKMLPATGNYTIRVYVGANNPAYVGTYAFRTYSEVFAHPDRYACAPSNSLVIPKQKFLCNDTCEVSDELEVDLTTFATTQGGWVTNTSTAIIYTPPAGFSGIDSFDYRLRGRFGGVDTATVTVSVFEGADVHPMLVSFIRPTTNTVSVCLLGAPGQQYQVEQSEDLSGWSMTQTLTADEAGSMTFDYVTQPGEKRYYRFRRP